MLVTRPAPLAQETAARLAALGHDVIVAPLLDPVALDWSPPEAVEALLFTSSQAPSLAGAPAEAYRGLPAYAIGERTAAAARAAGFQQVETLGGDVGSLLTAVAARHRRVLHLAGQDRTAAEPPPGLAVVVRAVYEARLAPLTENAAAMLRSKVVDWTLLFSTRTAAHFASLYDALGTDRRALSVGAISPTALAAAGIGWAQAVAAREPTEAGILAACGLSCDKAGPGEGR